jgi:hypothetical protein
MCVRLCNCGSTCGGNTLRLCCCGALWVFLSRVLGVKPVGLTYIGWTWLWQRSCNIPLLNALPELCADSSPGKKKLRSDLYGLIQQGWGRPVAPFLKVSWLENLSCYPWVSTIGGWCWSLLWLFCWYIWYLEKIYMHYDISYINILDMWQLKLDLSGLTC